MVWYTKTELILLNKLFKFEFNKVERDFEIFYNSNFPKLLSGRGEVSNSKAVKFIPVSVAPKLIQKRLTHEVCNQIHQQLQAINYELLVQTLTFESYFLDRLKELFQTTGYAEGYRDYQSIYADYDFLSGEKVIELAMLHAMIILIQRFAHDPMKLRFIYEHLCECNYGVEIPLTSFESFQKYLSRKRGKLPRSIIHGLYQQKSNNHEITELMQYVIVWIAAMVPTRRAVFSIKEDMDYILETMTNANAEGLYSLSEAKIASFLDEAKAKNLISFAKDNRIEFCRKVSGVMRFTRASAPLVRICIDGYVFQVEYKNGKKADRLTGIFISDDYSDYIISHKIGSSENYELMMQALEEYFRKTNNALPREIVVDKYTYRILKMSRAFIELLKHYGIEKGKGLTVSSNANRKARLERFFNTFQQKFMQTSIHYIGPGIKARFSNSHPFKEFLITMKKDLPEKFDLILLLDRLIKIHYNKEYISPAQSWLSTPEGRFKTEDDSNPLAIVDDKIGPTLFHELHNVTFKGGAVMIKRGKEFALFYKREFEFINRYSGKKLDAYFNQNGDGKSILLYEEETSRFITEIPLFTIIPVALFDRTEEHKEILKEFSKETREILSMFEAEFVRIEETIRSSFNGRDIRAFTKLAKMKKEKSMEQDLAEQMNLKTPKPEPKLYNANLGRNRTKSKSNLEALGITIIDTI